MAAETDPLDLPLRALLKLLLAGQKRDDDAGWINIRDERWPWRHIVASAEHGECRVSRVGRKLLMKREELDRWLDEHAIKPRSQQPAESPPEEPDPIKRTARRLLAEAGLGGRR